MKSQNKEIRKYLEIGRTLTPLDALYRFGCFRLSARIYDLRHEGMKIKAKTVGIISAGKHKHVTQYYVTKKT